MSKTVHVGCRVLYHVLPNLTSDVVLGSDWLHVINYLIDWNSFLLSLDHKGAIVSVLNTKSSCSCASVKVYTLKLVLKTMCSNKLSAWFGVLKS